MFFNSKSTRVRDPFIKEVLKQLDRLYAAGKYRRDSKGDAAEWEKAGSILSLIEKKLNAAVEYLPVELLQQLLRNTQATVPGEVFNRLFYSLQEQDISWNQPEIQMLERWHNNSNLKSIFKKHECSTDIQDVYEVQNCIRELYAQGKCTRDSKHNTAEWKKAGSILSLIEKKLNAAVENLPVELLQELLRNAQTKVPGEVFNRLFYSLQEQDISWDQPEIYILERWIHQQENQGSFGCAIS